MANFNIDYLVVAGGGGGGNAEGASGSGGGAGEYLYQTGQSLTTGGSGYTVTVGAGGSGGAGSSYPSANGLSGSDSFFVRSVAGGGAGLFSSPGNLLQSVPGGSGGGARPGSGSGAASTAVAPGVGNAGGSSSGNGGGGGGGAGSLGTTGTTSLSGSGGNGLQNSITGVSTYYAGGGAGGNFAPTGGSIGSGGSGIGGTSSYTGTAGSGVNNTGSGGAGGSYATSTNPYIPYAGGDGGSGIVILRYPTADVASYTTTGISPTQTTNGTDTILSFTTVGTGTITFTPPPPPPPPFDGTKATTPVTGFDKINTTQGLKLPSGTNTNQPTGVQGMIRNDTNETTGSSASAIEHHNGTNWQYFAATESPDPLVGNPYAFVSASNISSYPSPQTGNTWFDISEQPYYNATKVGTIPWSAPGSFDFGNSTSNYFQWPNTGPFAAPSNILAISVWFKLDTTTSKAYPFSISQTNNANTYGIIQIRPDGGVIGIGFRNGSSGIQAQNSFLYTGTTNWTHLVSQYKNNSVELYINGNKLNIDAGSSAYAGGFSASSWFNNLSSLSSPTAQTGRLRNSSPVATDGKISKVGIYPAALTQSEIDALVAEGSGA